MTNESKIQIKNIKELKDLITNQFGVYFDATIQNNNIKFSNGEEFEIIIDEK